MIATAAFLFSFSSLQVKLLTVELPALEVACLPAGACLVATSALVWLRSAIVWQTVFYSCASCSLKL